MSDDRIPLCVNCEHEEELHTEGWVGMTRSRCSAPQRGFTGGCPCNGFIMPSPAQMRSRYSKARPVTPPAEPFRRVSADRELGGRASSSTNRQGSRLTQVGTSKDREEIPEWVMFGIRGSDGQVEVYVSTKLASLSLRQDPRGEFEKINAEAIRAGRLSDKPWNLSGRMVDYLNVRAKTYAEALKGLFLRGWTPDGTQEPSTADLQRQLALEDMARADAEADRILSITHEAEVVDDEIYDAELVEDDDD